MGQILFPARIQCPKLFFNTGHQFLMTNEGKLRTFINLDIKIIEILIWHDLFLILRVKLEQDTKVSSNSREEYKDGNQQLWKLELKNPEDATLVKVSISCTRLQ